MRTIVRFRTAEGDYAVEVEQVKEVRSATGLAPLPSPLPGVAGLLRRGNGDRDRDGDRDGDGDGDGALPAMALPAMAVPVLAILGGMGRHIVIIEKGPLSFGLLVEEVTGVLQVDDGQIGAPPAGQDGPLVSGVLHDQGGLVMLLDTDALAGRLTQ